jgi:broad specificity phosphatase PhoE
MENNVLRLYIVRHGQTQWNVEKRMQGQQDSELIQKGIDGALALGRSLNTVDFNCIYSSSSRRTLHTAELIRGDRNICILPDDKLREISQNNDVSI